MDFSTIRALRKGIFILFVALTFWYIKGPGRHRPSAIAGRREVDSGPYTAPVLFGCNRQFTESRPWSIHPTFSTGPYSVSPSTEWGYKLSLR